MNNKLTPTIIQDSTSGEVLMLGYMNALALSQTKEYGWVYFWSRSRKALWKKGETSGNMLKVKEILADCDNDALLIKVTLIGTSICHAGSKSCFYQRVIPAKAGIQVKKNWIPDPSFAKGYGRARQVGDDNTIK